MENLKMLHGMKFIKSLNQSSMKVKKFENVQSESGLMGFKWSNLNPPGTDTPLSHPYWKLQEFPFSHNWPSGVIRMGSQYESEKV